MTGKRLFKWDPLPKYQLDEEANLLYQMMNVTGEQFSIAQLAEGTKTDDYFDKDGMFTLFACVAITYHYFPRSTAVDAPLCVRQLRCKDEELSAAQ